MSIKPRGKRKVLSVFLVIVMMLSMCCVGCNGENEKENTIEQEMLSNEAVESIVFPHVVDDGKLEITSLFQYTGINPDCGNEEGTEIAAIQLKNASESYLVEADIVMTMEDGTELHFLVEELPTQKSTMAFSMGNVSLSSDIKCVSVICEATYVEMESTIAEDVVVNVDGINVTLTNIGSENIDELVISCRNSLDEEYFGGMAYQYIVKDIPANQTVNVEAVDCILGMADVVRMEMK